MGQDVVGVNRRRRVYPSAASVSRRPARRTPARVGMPILRAACHRALARVDPQHAGFPARRSSSAGSRRCSPARSRGSGRSSFDACRSARARCRGSAAASASRELMRSRDSRSPKGPPGPTRLADLHRASRSDRTDGQRKRVRVVRSLRLWSESVSSGRNAEIQHCCQRPRCRTSGSHRCTRLAHETCAARLLRSIAHIRIDALRLRVAGSSIVPVGDQLLHVRQVA